MFNDEEELKLIMNDKNEVNLIINKKNEFKLKINGNNKIKLTLNNKNEVNITINKEREFDIARVKEANQARLGIAYFSWLILAKLAENPELVQTYIKAKMKCFDYFGGISISYVPIVAQLANDSKTENVAIAIKKQFNDMRDKVEAALSKQLAINSDAFVDYCNNIMNKNILN